MNCSKEESIFLFSKTDIIGFILATVGFIGVVYNMLTSYSLPPLVNIPLTIVMFLGSFLTLRWLMTDSDKEETK